MSLITALIIFLITYLIVVQQARKRVEIGFVEYFRVGAVITAVTMVIGILILAVQVKRAESKETSVPVSESADMTLTVTSNDRILKMYTVVLVLKTPEARARGLQGFRNLRPDETALFLFERSGNVQFWMGTVSYAIDIIFVDERGIVRHISRDCRPGSSELYPSHYPVKWVIETAAGSGISPGDKISSPYFGIPPVLPGAEAVQRRRSDTIDNMMSSEG